MVFKYHPDFIPLEVLKQLQGRDFVPLLDKWQKCLIESGRMLQKFG
jgi:hypothetical protein